MPTPKVRAASILGIPLSLRLRRSSCAGPLSKRSSPHDAGQPSCVARGSSSEDKGPVYTPPYSDAYPVRLDNDQVIWLRPSPSRSPQGYKPIVVLDKQQRETKATVAALTVLEGYISNPEELRNALLLLADLSPKTLEKVWIVNRDESRFNNSMDPAPAQLAPKRLGES